jgi:hypothetical protein
VCADAGLHLERGCGDEPAPFALSGVFRESDHDLRHEEPRSMRPAIAEKIRELEDELDAEIAERRAELRFTVHERSVRFEEGIRRRHRELRIRLSHYISAHVR